MSSSSPLGDPRTGRNRRVPTRTRTFQHGTVDPVTSHRRPIFTIGNLVLLVIIVGFGMYATGNLPQLDTFFDQANNFGRVHNNLVVNALITYGAYLFGAVVLALFSGMLFLFVNAKRRTHSDPKGWHKVANLPPERRKSSARRSAIKRPSVIMPLGKKRAIGAANPAADTTAAASTTVTQSGADKAAAIANAARAEATLANAPADLPSFVRSPNRTVKPNAETAAPPPAITASTAPTIAPATVAIKPEPSVIPPPATLTPVTPAPSPTVMNARAEAAIAAAKATAAKAEATMAAAKAEAAIAAAKAEAAAAEAVIAAAKAEAITS